jgi:hypothetical protein
MKKVSLVMIAFFCAMLLNAQEETSASSSEGYIHPGLMYLGGSIGFSGVGEKHEDSQGSEDGPKFTQFNILPEFGYVLNDNLAVALGVGYRNFTYKRTETGFFNNEEFDLKDKDGIFLIEPMLKWYKQINNRLYCMPSFGVNLGFGNSSMQSLEYNQDFTALEVVTDEYKEFIWGLSIRPALKYFVAEQFALSFAYGNLYYGSNTSTSKEDDSMKWTTNSYGIDLSLNSIQIGMLYAF